MNARGAGQREATCGAKRLANPENRTDIAGILKAREHDDRTGAIAKHIIQSPRTRPDERDYSLRVFRRLYSFKYGRLQGINR
jgi:hypothetical protein